MNTFDLNEQIEFTNHLKTISKIYRPNSNKEWIQILCPYCDDAYRKQTVTHGHFYVSRYFNFGQCFRCETKVSTRKLLIDTGFTNITLLKSIFKLNRNIIYLREDKLGQLDTSNILEKHYNFKKEFPEYYKLYLNYLQYRIGELDFLKFKTYPLILENYLAIAFNNYYNEISTIRFINNNALRYYKLKINSFYFFQDPTHYSNIVVCEGSFDLINLYKYSTVFDNNASFYIALNGRSYVSDIAKLVIEYYMIGYYTINIVFDKNLKNQSVIQKSLELKVNELNSNIHIKYYIPTLGKDVSEFNYIHSI